MRSSNLLVIFLLGLNGLGVGQNCPPFPSETRPGRSVVSRGAYFLAGGFLGVEAGLLDSAADFAVVRHGANNLGSFSAAEAARPFGLSRQRQQLQLPAPHGPTPISPMMSLR